MTKKSQKIIKVRLFTWFENVESHIVPGEVLRTERIAHMGDDVDINDEQSLARGEELDAFFSDKDAEAIRNGTYSGPLAAHLEVVTGQAQKPETQVTDLEGEGPQTDSLSAEELGEYINENKLNVDQTVALAEDGNTESIEKVWDAEEHAAKLNDAEPRKGVTDKLDAKLKAAASA